MDKKNIGIVKKFNLYKNIFVRSDFNVYRQCYVDFKIYKKKGKRGDPLGKKPNFKFFLETYIRSN